MESEGSLPHSQVPTTCSYPQPEQFSPCPPWHFVKVHLNIILPSDMIRCMVIQIFMYSYDGTICVLIYVKNKPKYVNIVRRKALILLKHMHSIKTTFLCALCNYFVCSFFLTKRVWIRDCLWSVCFDICQNYRGR